MFLFILYTVLLVLGLVSLWPIIACGWFLGESVFDQDDGSGVSLSSNKDKLILILTSAFCFLLAGGVTYACYWLAIKIWNM